MKKSIISLLLMVAMLPLMANAQYVQLADGVYQDGTTLYISSGVTTLGDLQVNPNEIYCYATIPPACMANTFTGYGATLHVPAAAMVSYFTTLYWYNFNNILSDAIEPLSVSMSTAEAELEIGQQLSLSATVAPGNATPNTVYWTSTDASVATVSGDGTVTAVATGECDILAICVDKVAVCHVTVVNPRVTITLDTHEARLLPNHTLTLTANCSPIDVDLAVTSSNPGVAIPRLVNGTIMVVGVAEGTATITVNAADGWGNPDECVVTVYTELGDTNSDGYVNIADVAELIDYLLSGNASQLNLTNADTDQNGNVNIADVSELIDYLLSGKWPWQQDQTFIVNGVSFKMVYVEGGTFTMGATAEQGSDARDNEKPAHEVTLSSYCIGQTEVTQALWQAVMGANPSYFTGDLNCPVEQVSWDDCQEFIYRLNQITGKTFRLPSEAEWEYAARGGSKCQGYKYAGSNTIGDVAWYSSNADNRTHTVATKMANELGIYDMSGNVWEWCQDRHVYNNNSQLNPFGPATSSVRDLRGGGWNNPATDCRLSYRAVNDHWFSWYGHGVRLALEVEHTNRLKLSQPVVKLDVNEEKTIDILNGSGNYTVEGISDIVTIEVNGNQLVIKGNSVGLNYLTLTDNTSGEQIALTYIVEPEGSSTVTVNGVSFKMIEVEGGTFTMGATAEQGSEVYSNERPTHQVTISDFAIGVTEVTQELWVAVMGSNPSNFTGNLKRPVESVSWNDCQMFIAKLNELTGKQFRLPTEAEWEYAARGGNRCQGYKYAGSNTVGDIAWYGGNSNSTTHPVATKAPNELGVYDMSGNVWEFCQDWNGNYSSEAQINPMGPTSGSHRVDRGGCWYNPARSSRVSCRGDFEPTGRSYQEGLRLALDIEDSPKFRLSETVVTVEQFEKKTVNIINGNGNYSVTGGSGFVTTSINGDKLTVTGTSAGTNSVHITDNASGATAVLTVIVGQQGEHEWVDLGLPSGTLWATCNVGASSPEDYGDYFAWGETEPKDVYNWSTYKWCNGSSTSMTKYCTNSSYGTVDNKTELDPEDDAAYVNWGENWRMPTSEQRNELYDKCTWTWTTLYGVTGQLVSGPNGNTIFLPAAGYRWDNSIDEVSSWGHYWSRTLASSFPYSAVSVCFSGTVLYSGHDRYEGRSVRPVRVSQN